MFGQLIESERSRRKAGGFFWNQTFEDFLSVAEEYFEIEIERVLQMQEVVFLE